MSSLVWLLLLLSLYYYGGGVCHKALAEVGGQLCGVASLYLYVASGDGTHFSRTAQEKPFPDALSYTCLVHDCFILHVSNSAGIYQVLNKYLLNK